jgi:hypothetical protein
VSAVVRIANAKHSSQTINADAGSTQRPLRSLLKLVEIHLSWFTSRIEIVLPRPLSRQNVISRVYPQFNLTPRRASSPITIPAVTGAAKTSNARLFFPITNASAGFMLKM